MRLLVFFSEKERLLANEADLTRSMLMSGLNSLRKAGWELKGEYYQAFFSLSIGLERMLKILYVQEYRANHDGEFPGSELRNISHNLVKLWNIVGMKPLEGIHKEILEFLDAFAGYGRYYNLDIMIGLQGKNMDQGDVLTRWATIQNKILDETGKKRYMKSKQEFVNTFGENFDILQFNLKGEEVRSISQVIDEEVNLDIIQGYSVQYIFEIIKLIYYKICEIKRNDYRLPELDEFFEYFSNYWKPYQIRNKKNWFRLY